MDYHLDLTLGGNAVKLQFLWNYIAQQLDELATLNSATNLAIQQIKYDKPEFVRTFINSERTSWRAFRQQLNLWMQRNQTPRFSLDKVHNTITAFNEGGTEQTEEEIQQAEKNFAEVCRQMRERNAKKKPLASE